MKDSACHFLLPRIYEKIVIYILCQKFYEDNKLDHLWYGKCTGRNERNNVNEETGRGKRYSFCLMVEASDHGYVLHTRRIRIRIQHQWRLAILNQFSALI
jgi:hypothetical protein